MADGTPMINLRSDTQTLPTRAMREAISEAELGDDTYGEDPTVRALEERVAALFNREAAMLVLSGTMANLVALLVHCSPGDEAFSDAETHVVLNEAGGFAGIAGVVMSTVQSIRGHILPEALAEAVRGEAVYHPRPRLVWLENTHNRGGGSVMGVSQFDAVTSVATSRGLKIHLDGARIFNAAVATGCDVERLGRGVDSVFVDLTKALSCPLGSLLVGDSAFIDQARFYRRMVGGGMRQAGIIAAAGLVAFDTLIDRLIEDHHRAKWLAERIPEIDGFTLDPTSVETNMVYVDVSGLGASSMVTAVLKEEGLLVSDRPPGSIRLVTHRHIDASAAEAALAAMSRASQSLIGRAKAQDAEG